MRTADFLFPSELEVTPTGLRNVLIVGSCMAEVYQQHFSAARRDVRFDLIVVNNASDVPAEPPQPASAYDLQYVQLPLRSIVSDAMVQAERFNSAQAIAELRSNAVARLELMLDAALRYNGTNGLLTLVQNFIVPQVRVAPSLHDAFSIFDLTSLVEELNRRIGQLVAERQNVFIADVNGIAGTLGKKFFFDDGLSFYSHGGIVYPDWADADMNAYWTHPERGRIEDVPPLDLVYELRLDEFLGAVYRQIEVLYRVVRRLDPVKLVIFDLDDTLWRGRIAEHYGGTARPPFVDGWPLGLWEAVHHLRWRGIVTALCSRNDPSVVEARWNLAVDPPFVKLDDFLCREIGWGTKAESVSRILAAVNLTARSAVFVDDNPVERESVKAAFPEIRVLGANPFVVRRVLLWSAETQVPYLTDESVRREAMLKGQIQRDVERTGTDRDTFLRNRGVTVRLSPIEGPDDPALGRCIELVNKTNQFNTTGARWTLEEVRAYLGAGHELWHFRVSDKYVDYGLVGVIFVAGNAIAQMAMSCRVLGMDVEIAVVARLAQRMRERHATVVGHIVDTPANGPCRELFTRTGFALDATDGAYALAGSQEPVAVAHVAVEFTEPAPASAG
jgi:FkbH-like protein